jgi:hypothetical protein
MQKIVFNVVLMGLTLASTICQADDALKFNGKWCGKWDGEFDVCFDIKANKNKSFGYQVIYSWAEFIDRPQLTKELIVEKVNANTITMGNKVLIFSHVDNRKALGIGLFDQMSRLAPLIRQ